ncbi:hypothetical protein PHLCEN_2v1522 [Hermanssonia centrifuga]|uniref:Uncharacterized protein n=1 Tax=Hermanssonia centrifuga TaxID=98765 RepID=A0A2R6RZS4_9APHY|nr:hypothetical protein PHLCEN_2v1522 [Hermanssonia centrifuga]
MAMLWHTRGARAPGEDLERNLSRLIPAFASSISESHWELSSGPERDESSSSLSGNRFWRTSLGELEAEDDGDWCVREEGVVNVILRGYVVKGYVYGVSVEERLDPDV